MELAALNDFDSIGLSVLKRLQSTQTQRQFTQELRIASDGERTIDYVAGLFYVYQTLIRAEDCSWDLYVWSRNLFDDDYYINYNVAANGLAIARVGDPRTIGVTGRFRL